MERILVVNADDFGMAPEINAGILRAHEQGIVTSTSVMANMPEAPAVADAQVRFSKLGFGLHLCLTEGKPVSEPGRVRSLIDGQSNFHSRDELFRRAQRGEVDLIEVGQEVRAQLDRLAQLGVRPDHWNSHQYVHFQPKLLRVIKHVLSPDRIPCMRTHCRAYIGRGGWLQGADRLRFYIGLPTRMVKDVYFGFESRIARRQGFRLPDGQLMRVPFGATFDELAANVTKNAPGGVYEWVCHPATESRPGDKASINRPGELAVLIRPALRDALVRAGFRLSTFREIASRR